MLLLFFSLSLSPQHSCNADAIIIITLQMRKMKNTAGKWQDQAGSQISATSHFSLLLFCWRSGSLSSVSKLTHRQRGTGVTGLRLLQEEPLWRKSWVNIGKEAFISPSELGNNLISLWSWFLKKLRQVRVNS